MDLERESIESCNAPLARIGFRPKRRGIYLQSGPDKAVSGWLGLNTATFRMPASLEVNPVVGVRHAALEQEMIRLDGRRAPFPAVTISLGYLMPDKKFRSWEFTADNQSSAAEELAAAIEVWGQPFIRRFSAWNTFAAEIGASGLLLEHDAPKVLAIVHALNGETPAANDLVQQELGRIAGMNDAYALSYRAFADKFRSARFKLG